ncbi:MAG: hypothetical protein BroJett015_44440 [Chloroflexota bacterium]|nr:MAG: hypothetical protein BroJett015_44440 [Chloroflexota bacterium]
MNRAKKWLPRLLPWLITLLLLRFLVTQGGDWQELRQELAGASLGLLALAVLFQAGTYAAVAWYNELLLRSYQVRVPWFRQYSIQFAMSFVETAVPSAAVSGLVLRARLLKPYGATADVATVTTVVETFSISLTVLAPALFVGAFVAIDGVNAGPVRLLLLALAVVMGVLLGVARWRAHWLRAGSAAVQTQLAHWWDAHAVSRWPQRLAGYPSHRLAGRTAHLWREMAAMLRQRPHWLLAVLLLRTGCEIIAFGLCFYAFGETLPLLTILLLYTITITVNTLGAVPGGVGLAETSLAAIYTQLGLAPETAVAVALAYRLTGYWLPRAVGGFSWLWLERQHRAERRAQTLM